MGIGIAGAGFGLILAIVVRAAAPENRSLALGATTAVGSAGPVTGPLFAETLLALAGWRTVFLGFARAVLAVLPLLRALRDPSCGLIVIGFLSCGDQPGFISAPFPAFVAEVCGPLSPGSPRAARASADPRASAERRTGPSTASPCHRAPAGPLSGPCAPVLPFLSLPMC